jgi:hypothetical protein
MKTKIPLIPGQELETPQPSLSVGGVGIPLLSGEQQRAAQEREIEREIEQKAAEVQAGLPGAEAVRRILSGEGDDPVPPVLQQVLGLMARGHKPTAPKTFTRKDGSVWERDAVGNYKQVLGPLDLSKIEGTGGKLTDKVIGELSDMRVMHRKAMDLVDAPNDYKLEVVGWVPNLLRNIGMGDPNDTDINEDMAAELAAKYQIYQPQYFMFAAEMLKAIQGSRPSDFDMRIYLENLPKLTDTDEAKAEKLTNLINQLTFKYNDRIDAYSSVGRNMGSFKPIGQVSKEDLLARIQKANREFSRGAGTPSAELPPLPPGFVPEN